MKYKDGPYDNIDVFIVLEDNKYQLKIFCRGITKTNSKVDHKAELSITKKMKAKSHAMFQNTRLQRRDFLEKSLILN